MATLTLTRPDVFPDGTSVSIFPAAARRDGVPPGSAIASGTVSSGTLSITSGSIVAGTPYVAYAAIGGVPRYIACRSTADTFDRGNAVGTANTSSGSASLASVTASSGAFAIGQRITGPGIPAGTTLISGSGASWTMSAKAAATGTGVAVQADGARGPGVVLGASATPQTLATTWQARVRQRRLAMGTS